MTTEATPREVGSHEGLGQAPERDAFERHAESLGYSADPDTRPGREGGYWSSHTHLMWETWQAAVAAERERWRTAALAGCDGTHPKYAEALRNLVAMLDAGVA